LTPHPGSTATRVRIAVGVIIVAGTLLEPRHEVCLAYVDPGFGSMIVQLLFATGFGALFYVRSLRRYLARWVARLRGRIID
jgi:hypothetical protein